jgi:hypothetical protein
MKCRNCGLSNFDSAAECRRCGTAFSREQTNRVGKRPPRFSVASLIVYAVVALGGYYLYAGIYRSVVEVDANDAYRVGSQPPQKAGQQGLTRSESDRQRANGVGQAIKQNPAIQSQEHHNEEMQQAIRDASR